MYGIIFTLKDKTMISIIVAFDKNFCIGKDGKLPWHIKEDLKWFKERTLNHTIVMGKNTFLSIGKILPNRKTILVSNSLKIEEENCHTIQNLQEFLEENKNSKEEIFVCGGESIYRQALPYAKKFYLTLIDTEIENGDTFFPKIDLSRAETVYEKTANPSFKFLVLERELSHKNCEKDL